jgi:hypothetical protein
VLYSWFEASVVAGGWKGEALSPERTYHLGRGRGNGVTDGNPGNQDDYVEESAMAAKQAAVGVAATGASGGLMSSSKEDPQSPNQSCSGVTSLTNGNLPYRKQV